MANNDIIAQIEAEQLKSDLPQVNVGNTVDVHVRIIEGEKERIQVFTGVVIAIKGSGINQVITVRRIVANEGVERVFPVHSPRIAKIEIVREGHVRRSKLYFLRDRIGKARRLKDRRRGLGKFDKLAEGMGVDTSAEPEPATDESPAEETAEAETK
jgi:large subunit ribosomal protein L19